MGATMSNGDTIKELQNWFRSQCDGEWEHQHGIKIESCDNPGWWVKIDLRGTKLLERPFLRVTKNYRIGDRDPQSPWMYCDVKDGVFHGAGDPHTLGEIIRVFLEWARE